MKEVHPGAISIKPIDQSEKRRWRECTQTNANVRSLYCDPVEIYDPCDEPQFGGQADDDAGYGTLAQISSTAAGSKKKTTICS